LPKDGVSNHGLICWEILIIILPIVGAFTAHEIHIRSNNSSTSSTRATFGPPMYRRQRVELCVIPAQ
jgi:hypothetical protein